METRVENIVESFDYILIHTKEGFSESIKILNKDKKNNRKHYYGK